MWPLTEAYGWVSEGNESEGTHKSAKMSRCDFSWNPCLAELNMRKRLLHGPFLRQSPAGGPQDKWWAWLACAISSAKCIINAGFYWALITMKVMSKEAEKLKVIENLPKVGTQMFNQALSLMVTVHSLTWMLKDLVIFWVVLCSPSVVSPFVVISWYRPESTSVDPH